MESNMQASPTGGRRAYKWLVLLVVILLLFCAWLFFRQQSLRHDLSKVGSQTLTLQGTVLVLEGGDGSRVDLFPIIKQQFDLLADDLTKVTNIYNTYPVTENITVIQETVTGGGSGSGGGTSTSPQTLSLAGNVLSISDGNSVALPNTPAGDPTVGNEILDVVAGGGLLRVGTGTTVDPYKISIQNCANNEIIKSDGTNWNCATESAGTTYSAGTGLSLVGTTFNNTGVLSVAGSGAVTSTGGANPTIAFANGSVSGQFWQWDGDSWELATLPANGDGVIGNEITNITGVNAGLVRSGAGTSVDPYTIAANVGNGLQLVSNAITINSPTCAGTTKLQWNGTAFVCATDQDTTYTAGTGLNLAGTVFSNTGVLTVAGSGPVTSTGGQNPVINFANGSSSGQAWQWDGDSWELAQVASGTCAVGSTYACDGGNTLASSLDIGTNDNNALNLRINNATAATLATTGSLSLVNGALTLGGTNTVGFTTPQAITIQSKINIPVYDPGNFGQVVAMGIGSAAQTTSRVLSLFDNRSVAHQPTIAVFAPNENNSVGFSWEGVNDIARIKNTNGGIAVRNGTTDNVYFGANGDVGIGNGTSNPAGRLQINASTGTILHISDAGTAVMTIQDEGLAVFQNKTDMTSAFRVASANGTILFSLNTINKTVNIGEGEVNVGGSPSLLVLDHSTASSDPTGINGAMYYNETFNSLRCYEAGVWKSCLAPVDATVSFNETMGTTWTTMPAALTELFGVAAQRMSLDTTGGVVQARLMANVATVGAAGAELRLQYSVNNGSSWQYVNGATGPSVPIDATGLQTSAWVNMENAAITNDSTWFRVVGINGDGVASPVIGSVKMQLR